MTIAQTSQAATQPKWVVFSKAFFASTVAGLKQRSRIVRSLQALHGLNSHMLRDIGLYEMDVRGVERSSLGQFSYARIISRAISAGKAAVAPAAVQTAVAPTGFVNENQEISRAA